MKQLIFLLLFVSIGSSLCAQMEKVYWSFSTEKVTDNEYDLILEAEVSPGWFIYSQYLESNEGPIATEITLNENPNLEIVGKSTEEGKKIDGYDNIFQMNIAKFKESVKFVQRIKVKSGLEQISGYVTFMTCNNDTCLPPKT